MLSEQSGPLWQLAFWGQFGYAMPHWRLWPPLCGGLPSPGTLYTERVLMAAKKIVDRKALREEVEAAEAAEKTKKKTVKRKKAKRKSRSKEPVEVRIKLFWGVFNQSMKRIALFEHDQKKAAEAKAKALSQSGKSPHFVQKVKEAVE